MGRWDAVLPYLSPSRGASPSAVPGRSSLRERVLGSPRSSDSPGRSSTSSGSGPGTPREENGSKIRLPDIEDIYDLLTADLAALEEQLSAKASSSSLSAKEEKFHKLIKVELGERRGVEEIGLALIGSRFDIGSVPGLGRPATPLAQVLSSPGKLGRNRERPSSESAPQVWTLHDAPSPSSSSRSGLPTRTPSPSQRTQRPGSLPGIERNDSQVLQHSQGSQGPSQSPTSTSSRSHSGAGGSSGGLSKAFKPTPVDFDFVIGSSSVKKKVPKRKPKPKPPEEKPAKDRTERAAAGSRREAAKAAPGRPGQASSAGNAAGKRSDRSSSQGPGRPAASASNSRSASGKGAAKGTGRGSKKDGTQANEVCTSSGAEEGPLVKSQAASAEEQTSEQRSSDQQDHLDSAASSPYLQLCATLELETGHFPPASMQADQSQHVNEAADTDEAMPNQLETNGAAEADEEPQRELQERPAEEHEKQVQEDPDKEEQTEQEEHEEQEEQVVEMEEPGQMPDSLQESGGQCGRDENGREADEQEQGEGSDENGYEDGYEDQADDNVLFKAFSPAARTGKSVVIACAGQTDPGDTLVPDQEEASATGAETASAERPASSEPVSEHPELLTVLTPRPVSADSRRPPSQGHRPTSSELPVEAEGVPRRSVAGAAAAQTRGRTGAAGRDAAGGNRDGAEKDKAEKPEKPSRRPPLPYEALRATAPGKNSVVRTSNELDFVGLDPKLVERGEIRSYGDHFTSIASIFTWGQSSEAATHKERYLKEALQLFGQFCDIIGSLEDQFVHKIGPAEKATPNATQSALSAMTARGAGLYGVFLKGIIDKMDSISESVPRPISAPSQRDVCSLRYYKVVQNRTEVYDIVTRVFHKKEGWDELPHGLGLSNAWNLCWTWSKPKLDYSRLCSWQKVNHFPENKHLTRKDFLKRCIDRYTRTGGKLAQFFNICPRTFVLPKEYCLFIECFAKIAEENGDLHDPGEAEQAQKSARNSSKEGKKEKVPNLWIMKPAGSSRGRGIQVVNDVGSVHYGELTIIQQYISDPFLLGGFKWDMRTYVTVTSFNPLEAFVYRDGFARFTTVPYSNSGDDIDNKFVHLTNSSIQRHNEDSMMQGDVDNPEDMARRQDAILGGTKISFSTLQERLRAVGVHWDSIWTKMIECILKSLCMAEDHIPYQVNSFELFGYDLMVDSKMKVWLIEVNASPSMGQEHLLDEQVKQPLISDTIDLVEPLEFDRRKLAEVLHRRVERKAATGATGGRQQLDIDLHAILKGKAPRKYGEMPTRMGNYERIAPSEMWDTMVRSRGLLFNKTGQ